ncbi:Bifunctional transglycosylase/transpeptidase penicillin-binding protein [Neochlamydia sp. S13]|nr:Bifunctional transglycosylase/transpeptidase penicillin-binding protein [Neochlamydia sp. S13]
MFLLRRAIERNAAYCPFKKENKAEEIAKFNTARKMRILIKFCLASWKKLR